MFEEKQRACFDPSEAAPALDAETDRTPPSPEPKDVASTPLAFADWVADGSLPG